MFAKIDYGVIVGVSAFKFLNSVEVPDSAQTGDSWDGTKLTPRGKSATELKIEGVEFNGVMCSATSEDMWGLGSIKDWVRAGGSTKFQFSNGNKLVLSSDNIDAFEAVWVPFRVGFFE